MRKGRRGMKPDQLRAWRERRRWTQQQAAEATGYSPATWQSWELGRRAIREPLLQMLALLDKQPRHGRRRVA